jgi:hypothetical protein
MQILNVSNATGRLLKKKAPASSEVGNPWKSKKELRGAFKLSK